MTTLRKTADGNFTTDSLGILSVNLSEDITHADIESLYLGSSSDQVERVGSAVLARIKTLKEKVSQLSSAAEGIIPQPELLRVAGLQLEESIAQLEAQLSSFDIGAATEEDFRLMRSNLSSLFRYTATFGERLVNRFIPELKHRVSDHVPLAA